MRKMWVFDKLNTFNLNSKLDRLLQLVSSHGIGELSQTCEVCQEITQLKKELLE